jgi:hypothetical protein
MTMFEKCVFSQNSHVFTKFCENVYEKNSFSNRFTTLFRKPKFFLRNDDNRVVASFFREKTFIV